MLPDSLTGAEASEADDGIGGASANPAVMEATDGARELALRTDPGGVASPLRCCANGLRLPLASLGVIDLLLGPAIAYGAGGGLWITLKVREGDSEPAPDACEGVVLASDMASAGVAPADSAAGTEVAAADLS